MLKYVEPEESFLVTNDDSYCVLVKLMRVFEAWGDLGLFLGVWPV